MVRPTYKDSENAENKTPKDVFAREHQALAEKGEKWLKDTASSCMLVGTLIITVVFAAAFTVPGGNYQDSDIYPQRHTNFLKDLQLLFEDIEICCLNMMKTMKMTQHYR